MMSVEEPIILLCGRQCVTLLLLILLLYNTSRVTSPGRSFRLVLVLCNSGVHVVMMMMRGELVGQVGRLGQGTGTSRGRGCRVMTGRLFDTHDFLFLLSM